MRKRRAAVLILEILGGLVATLAVLVGVTWLALQTRWGGERLRRQVVALANQQLMGKLEVERLSFGGNRVVVWGVTLRDPSGERVAEVARAEVDFAITRLLHKELHLKAVAIEGPRLLLASDAEGLNLSRATAARKETPAKPKAPRTTHEGWVVVVDRFDLSGGEVRLTTTAEAPGDETRLHYVGLNAFVRARYATGNGALDVVLNLQGQNLLAPTDPLRLSAEAGVHGEAIRFAADGDLLGGPLRARGKIDRQHPERADVSLLVAIPERAFRGYDFGPIGINGRMTPGAIPTLDLDVELPGVSLVGKGGGTDRFTFEGSLALSDLALTGEAVRALAGAALPPLGGHGRLDVTLDGLMAGAPASWGARVKGSFEKLRAGDALMGDLSVNGNVTQLSSRPEKADLAIASSSISTGTTRIRGLELHAGVRGPNVEAALKLAAPERASLAVAGRLDDDRQGFVLTSLDLAYPQGHWQTTGPAHLRYGNGAQSLKNLHLAAAEGQSLSLEAVRSGDDRVEAHAALEKLRLELLPVLLAPPALRLGGVLDVDIKASGRLADPRVDAQARLRDGRYRGFSGVRVKVDAKLVNQEISGTLGVAAPFAEMDASFLMPSAPLTSRSGMDVRIDVNRFELGPAMRDAGLPRRAEGELTLGLRVTGNPRSPKVNLTLSGRELKLARQGTAAKGTDELEVGRARLRATYADRIARGDLDFASSHGGTLRVDAEARVDLSYPRITRGIVPAKIPVHGKVQAHDLDVAWLAALNDRVESLGGQVNADARLAGTVGDPQVVGDVRWKNGQVVATSSSPPKAAVRPGSAQATSTPRKAKATKTKAAVTTSSASHP